MPKELSRQPWSAVARLLVGDTTRTIKANADTKLAIVVNIIEVVIGTTFAATFSLQDQSGVVFFATIPAAGLAAGVYKFGPYQKGIVLPVGQDLRVVVGAAGYIGEIKAEGWIDGMTS